jgi:hypothetical protein
VNTFGQSASVRDYPAGEGEPTLYIEEHTASDTDRMIMALRARYTDSSTGMMKSYSGGVSLKRRISSEGMWWLGLL